MIKSIAFKLRSLINGFIEKFNGLDRKVAQKTFSTQDRILLYENLGFLLDNKIPIEKSLINMRDTLVTGKGRQTATVHCLNDAIGALKRGQSIDIGLRDWIPKSEVAMLSAAVKEEQLSPSLKRAISIVEAMDKIKGTLIEKLSQPAFLMFSLIGLATMLSHQFLPKMELLSPRDSWTGAMEWLAILSDGIGQHLIIVSVLAIFIFAWTVWSLPNLTGRFRSRFLDKLPPWSVYRDIQGVSFLLSYSALIRANVKTEDAIIILSKNSSPWLHERLIVVRRLLQKGRTLGDALKESGYNFPSKEAVERLVLLTSGDYADTIIENYALERLKKTISFIGYLSGRIQLVLYLLCGVYMGLVAYATQNLSGV